MEHGISRKKNNDFLDEEDTDHPLFKELHLVVIGCHGSGKNAIVNAIFRNNVFTFSTSSKKHVEIKRTVFGTRVTIVRAPGWSEELTSLRKHRELRQEISDAVRSFEKGPHAIILSIAVNSTLTETTQATLEKLLTRRFWDHTIIIFKGDLQKANSEDKKNIQTLIKALNKRCCVLQTTTSFEESKKLIEDIALMIAGKQNVPLRFSVDESEKHDESHEKKNLLKRLRQKIEKLKKLDRNVLTKRAESTNNLVRLQKILGMHEDPDTDSTQSDQSTREEENTEREERTSEAMAEIHPTETSKLLDQTEMASDKDQARDAHKLNGTFQCDSHTTPISEGDLYSWYGCLVEILEDLTEEQFKKMKNKICNMKDDRIRTLHVEDKNRNTLAHNMIQHWGEEKCISYTRDILKDIPRNDNEVKDLILPFLQRIGESW
ncbi:uncharacterized protein LOC111194402 [Astyanax mexicanus]|uniref:uncharacterized protein LOC111194402 n=1 Tax=Astyanax mexicanus TaxID=7994 RepID=UPI0020CB03DC|nr:uncharacterized protein LOC111194402 [Astyanax mexicanus]